MYHAMSEKLGFFFMCSLMKPQTCTTPPEKAIDETNWLRKLGAMSIRKILLTDEVAV